MVYSFLYFMEKMPERKINDYEEEPSEAFPELNEEQKEDLRKILRERP